MDLDYLDLSFLDDVDKMASFVESLFSCHVLLFKNEDFDMRVLELQSEMEVQAALNVHLQSPTTQMIIANGTNDKSCPFFRVVMQDYGVKTPINYKLETFFRASGILGIHARCNAAMVIGLTTNDSSSSMISVPAVYRTCPIVPIDMMSPIDLTWTQSEIKKNEISRLMSIPGMSLPVQLPQELHFNIFKYLRHPCAEIILQHKKQMLQWIAYWDRHFAIRIRSFGTW